MALTDAFFKAQKPRDRRYEVGDDLRPGLRMIVLPSGKRSWIYRFRDKAQGKQFGLVLGAFPALSLADARAAAGERARQVAAGKNPVLLRDEERERMVEAARAEKLADEDQFGNRYAEYERGYIKKKGVLRASTAAEVARIFDRHANPAFKGLRVDEIKASKIEKLLAEVAEENGPAAANKLFAWLRHFFGWFEVKRDDNGEPILARSPMIGMEKPSSDSERERILTDDELRWFWKACDEDASRKFEVQHEKKRIALESTFGKMLQLTLLNLVRRDEMRCARLPEFDLNKGNWLIPGERTKNGRPHLVPMADAAVAILRDLPRVEGAEKFIFSTTGTSAMSGLAKGKKRIADAMLRIARDEAKKRGDDPENVEIPQWQIHDLRRTGVTTMARLGVGIEIRKRCANQTTGDKLDKTYNHWDFEPEKRAAFSTWADFVIATVNQTPGKVIPFKRGAA